jgi:hypothetical protein
VTRWNYIVYNGVKEMASLKELLGMNYRRLPAIIAAALLGITSTFSVSAASAQTQMPGEVYTCGSTNSSNYHVGKFQALGTGSYEGAYAYIATRYGAVCDTDTSANNFQNPYAMIASGDGNGYAQSGYTRWYNSCTYFFAEQSKNGSTFYDKFGTTCVTTDGTTHKYTEEYFSSCSCVKSMVDGTPYMTSNWNPFNNWSYPFSPQFEGEAIYRESDMPGNSASPTSFTDLHYQNTDNSWGAYGCGALNVENLGSGDRADGEEWFNSGSGMTCPDFNIYTDTSVSEGSATDPY